MSKNIFIPILCFFILINCIEIDEKPNPLYKCNIDKLNIIPQGHNLIIPLKNNNIKVFSETNNFKKFNIYLDLNNFDYEINKYNLEDKREYFITGMNKAKETLASLLELGLSRIIIFMMKIY